ncbi:UNVERIFIED_CONTAM: hypothetical protein B566_EDAN019552 [Ephemera danica]|nr:hypothetical protein B566_EDAN019552 [Ephemera danica]
MSVSLPNFLFVDSLWLTLQLRGRDQLLVGIIYRSPSSKTEDDVFLSNFLLRIPDLGFSHILILGDFNAPSINWHALTSPQCGFDSVLLSTAVTLGWHQHSLHPTRFRQGHRPSTLDLVFTNERPMIDEIKSLSPLGKSDHTVLSWDLMCYWTAQDFPSTPRLALHRGDYTAMNKYLSSTDWHELIGLSPDEQEKTIAAKIAEACDLFIPMFTPTTTKTHKYPGRIRRLLNRKRTAWALYSRTHCDIDYEHYLVLRRQSVLATRSYKRQNEEQLLLRAQSSPKLLFRFIRSRQKTKPSPLSLCNGSDSLTSSPKEAADTLALAYASVYTTSSHFLTDPHKSIPINTKLQSVSFPIPDVQKLLSLCDPGGSPGPDEIHPKLLKECASALAIPFQILFTTSFMHGVLPTAWKRAIIHPIYKADKHKDLGVWISSNLSPSLMCLHSSKKAVRMLNLFRRSFPSIDQKNFLLLYSSFVRPHLEHCSIAWLPWLKKDEALLENVQRKATKTVRSLRNLPYPDRLSRLNLFPLKYRRLRGSLIYTFRLFQTESQNHFFTMSHNTSLRGHSRKIFHQRFTSRPCRSFFSSSVVHFWNNLPESVIRAPSLFHFKKGIDLLLPKLFQPSQ